MQFLIIIVVFAALMWLVGLLLPALVTIPSSLPAALVGLGKLVGDVGFFVPVGTVISAIAFTVAVFQFRIAIQLFKWVIKLLPFVEG